MKKSHPYYRYWFPGAIIGLLLACSVQLAAAEEPDSWQHELTIYGWLTDIAGTVHAPRSPGSGQGFTVDISDIIDNLEFAMMGTWASKKGKWSFIADVIYSDVGSSANGIDVDMTTWVLNGGMGYDLVQSDSVILAAVVGVRYLDIEPEVKLGGVSKSASEGFTDGMIGLRGNFNLNNNWYLPYYADVGTGDSELSYQLFAGIGYRFGWGDVRLGYRHLKYEMDDDAVVQDMSLSGPIMGVGFTF